MTIPEAPSALPEPQRRVEVWAEPTKGDKWYIGTIPSTEAISVIWLKEHFIRPNEVLYWYWSPNLDIWLIRVRASVRKESIPL